MFSLNLQRPSQSEFRRSLHHDHTRLDRLFDKLVRACSMGEREQLDSLWKRFERGLRRHFKFEEREILPHFRRTQPEEAAELEREHAELLAKLDQFGVAVDLHLLRADMVAQFVAELRAHAVHEDRVLYAWLDAQVNEHAGDWTGRARVALHKLLSPSHGLEQHHTRRLTK